MSLRVGTQQTEPARYYRGVKECAGKYVGEPEGRTWAEQHGGEGRAWRELQPRVVITTEARRTPAPVETAQGNAAIEDELRQSDNEERRPICIRQWDGTLRKEGRSV